MRIIHGYKIETTDMKKLDYILHDIQKFINDKARKYYIKLLSREIESTLDDLSLNVLNRNENQSVYDLASNSINEKIIYTSNQNVATLYNMNVSISVYMLNDETYIMINSLNSQIFKHLTGIKGVTEYSVEHNKQEGTKVADVWNTIKENYEDDRPLTLQVLPNNKLFQKVEFNELSFSKYEDRVSQRVRFNIFSKLLTTLNLNRDIQSYQLMPLFDEALHNWGCNEVLYLERLELEKKLGNILIENITEELIYKIPSEIEAEEDQN